jgi:copper chaperone CopZ
MSCKNCQKSVETAILALPKVKRVDIDLKSGQATAFSEEHLDPEMLQQTIEKIGYSIVQNQ